MADFIDRAGNVKPVRLKKDDSVPTAETAVEHLLLALLAETRAARLGVEMHLGLNPGDLLALAGEHTED